MNRKNVYSGNRDERVALTNGYERRPDREYDADFRLSALGVPMGADFPEDIDVSDVDEKFLEEVNEPWDV